MENQLQVFQSQEFGALEIIMINDKPHFPASDCAKILGYSNPRDAILKHCRCVAKRDVPHPQSGEKVIEVNYIPEGDLYRLITRSKLPAAIRFENWIFDEVVPSIRKHGAYITENTLRKMVSNPEFTRDLMIVLLEEKAALQGKIAELAPKAHYCDIILKADNAVQVTIIAQDYGMSAMKFNQLLHEMKIQRKVNKTWVLYQEYAGEGYTDTLTYNINDNMSVVSTLWTQKGRLFLYEKLKEANILPIIESTDK